MIKSPPTPQDMGYAVAANFGNNPELAHVVAGVISAAYEQASRAIEAMETDSTSADVSLGYERAAAVVRKLKGNLV